MILFVAFGPGIDCNNSEVAKYNKWMILSYGTSIDY